LGVIIDEMGENIIVTDTNYSMENFVSGAHLTTGKAAVNLEKNNSFIE